MKLNDKMVGILISSLAPLQDQNPLIKVLYALWERHKNDEAPEEYDVNPCTLGEDIYPVLELVARPVPLMEIQKAIDDKIEEMETEKKKGRGAGTTPLQEIAYSIHQQVLERDKGLLQEIREIVSSLELFQTI